jgi:hypothetical protein
VDNMNTSHITFNQWLIEEFGQSWQGINDDLAVEGWNEEERYNYYYNLQEQYEEYCEQNDLLPQFD